MPYTYRKVGDEYCVYKKDGGTKVGCTKGSIKKYLEALHANENVSEIDKIKGGLADNKSIKDIADKHDTTVKAIKNELKKGEKVEKEHTSNKDVAKEIAKDHTWEDDKYYENPMFTKDLKESTKTIIKKILREEINLKVTDESPDTITILVEYNDRNAGIIMVTTANIEKTLEIVGVKFKPDYSTRFIISEAIKSLWEMFKNIDSIIVAPKPEGVEFWNKMGFNRISPNYLLKNRGH